MGIGKLILGLIVVGCILVLAWDIRRVRNEEKANEDLYKELDDVNAQLRKMDVEDDVLDAKKVLLKRKAKLEKKASKLQPKNPV